MNILVVDSNEASRALYKALFRKGHSITEAADSEKAMDLILQSQVNSNPFDVLIANQMIPGIMKSGCEFVRWAKGRVPFIIMATGTSCEAEAMEAGADKFFLVPIKNEVLKKAVEIEPLLKFA